MTISKEEYEAFSREYDTEEQEILVLFSDAHGGAGKTPGSSWTASAYFLAYQDVHTGEVRKGDGRVVWLIADEDLQDHGSSYPYFFAKGTICRVLARELINRTVPEGRLPSFYNRFLVVEVREENAHSDALAAVLEEYRRPIVLKDSVLGDLVLDKNLSNFEGSVEWCGRTIHIYLDVNKDDQDSWTKALNNLRTLYEQREERDEKFRHFATEKLTQLANDWRDDENPTEITEEDFAQRIRLLELSVRADGDYLAYYNDDDMFYGHVIIVSGSMTSGMEDANIAG